MINMGKLHFRQKGKFVDWKQGIDTKIEECFINFLSCIIWNAAKMI